MKKIVGLIMAVTIALSLNACTFTDQSETSNVVDESVSVDQGGQVIRVDIPNGDGTFTTLEGEEAQKWYDKAGEEDQQEAAKEASTQSIEEKEIFLVFILWPFLSLTFHLLIFFFLFILCLPFVINKSDNAIDDPANQTTNRIHHQIIYVKHTNLCDKL